MKHSVSHESRYRGAHQEYAPRLGRAILFLQPVLKLFIGKFYGRPHSMSLYQEFQGLIGRGESPESREEGMSECFLVFQF